MSETSSSPRRVLHLVIEGFPAEKLAELSVPCPTANPEKKILQLTEANAREALGKIFEADAIAVWGKL